MRSGARARARRVGPCSQFGEMRRMLVAVSWGTAYAEVCDGGATARANRAAKRCALRRIARARARAREARALAAEPAEEAAAAAALRLGGDAGPSLSARACGCACCEHVAPFRDVSHTKFPNSFFLSLSLHVNGKSLVSRETWTLSTSARLTRLCSAKREGRGGVLLRRVAGSPSG